VIEVSKNGRKVLNANVGIRMTCTSGTTVTVPDSYKGVPVTKKRTFSVSFDPVTQRNSDATTTDLEGSMKGTFNKARTKVSGTWSFKGPITTRQEQSPIPAIRGASPGRQSSRSRRRARWACSAILGRGGVRAPPAPR
jgi:hypothetical protein